MDSSIFFSSVSSFIVGLLTAVLLGGFSARDDRLQEHRVLVFDKGHDVHVVVPLNDENALAGITFRVGMFQHIKQVAALDVEDDVLEPDASLFPELRVLRVIPVEVLHCLQDSTMCASKAHIVISNSVPGSVPKRGPTAV